MIYLNPQRSYYKRILVVDKLSLEKFRTVIISKSKKIEKLLSLSFQMTRYK